MSDKVRDQSLSELLMAIPEPATDRDPPPALKLPIEEYAISIPTEIARSMVVISGSAGLVGRNRMPVQIFPAEGFLPGQVAARSSKDELRRVGLDKLFHPDPNGTINCLRLPYEGVTDSFLIYKLKPKHSPDHVKTICNRQADDIRALVHHSRHLVSEYEWQILRTVFLSTAPCLAVEPGQRVVSANPMLCELTERTHDQLVGAEIDDVIHMEREVTGDIARYPDYTEFTSPLFMRTLSAFFVSDLQLSVLDTACGERLIVVFRDLLTDQRTGNSNIHLIRKISAMVMSEDPPQKVLRRLSNVLTSALDCDLVCILRRKQNDELIVTPYVNRSLHTLRANIVERVKEPQLEPFFKKGLAVFCDQVEGECPPDSFFRRVLKISRFAFLPAWGHSRNMPF